MSSNPQLSPKRPKSLDHFLLLVKDLEHAAKTYRRLGFHVRPIAQHLDIGSSNCVVHFADTYLELFWFESAADALRSDTLIPYLDRFQCGEGMAHVSLTSDDLVTEQERLKEMGFQPGPVTSARRKITMPGGSEDETASSCFYIWRDGDARFLSLFFSAHPRPETIFIPQYAQHENTAVDVTRLVYMSVDPAKDAPYFSQAFGKRLDRQHADGFSFTGARGEVTEVLTPAAAVSRYGELLPCSNPDPLAGFALVMHLRAGNMNRCREALQRGNVAFEDRDGELGVPASEACGCALIFEHARR